MNEIQTQNAEQETHKAEIFRQYLELVKLTKEYLSQEYKLPDRILSDRDTCQFFRNYLLQKQEIKNRKITNTPPSHSSLPIPPLTSPIPSSKLSSYTTTTSSTVVDAEISKKEERKNYTPTPNILPKKESQTTLTQKEQKSEIKTPSLPQKEKTSTSPYRFTREIPSPSSAPDFTALRKMLKEALPSFQSMDYIPDDSKAKQRSQEWANKRMIPQILILSCDSIVHHQRFLENIAQSLEVNGIHTKVVHASKLESSTIWDKVLASERLKLIIASSSGFYTFKELEKRYKEGLKNGHDYLENKPLLLLSDIHVYFKEPMLKATLWKGIKHLMGTV